VVSIWSVASGPSALSTIFNFDLTVKLSSLVGTSYLCHPDLSHEQNLLYLLVGQSALSSLSPSANVAPSKNAQ
jgi:hypothetical protein